MSTEKLSTSTIPILDAEEPVLFMPWYNQMTAYVKSLSDTHNVLVDDPPPQVARLTVEQQLALNAAQRRVYDANWDEWKGYKHTDNRAVSGIWVGIAKNPTASSLIRTRTRNTVNLPPGEELPARVIMETLEEHYEPQSQDVIRLKEELLRREKVGVKEPLAKAMVRLTEGIADVEAQGKIYSTDEKKGFLISALSNGEVILGNLIQTLQFMAEDMEWQQVVNKINRFDVTHLGQLRLKGGGVKRQRFDAVMALGDSDDKSTSTKKCSHCKKEGHLVEKCWVKNPDLRPKRKKGASDGTKKGGHSEKKNDPNKKKAKFEWRKDKLTDSVSMLDEVFWMQSDVNDDKHIYLDSCASRKLFLLPNRNMLESVTEVSEALGTASKDGSLPVRGIGRVGSEEAKWCPDLRKSIISLGRLHSWNLSADLPKSEMPIIYDDSSGMKETVLSGEYKNGMPCFKLAAVLNLARMQDKSTVCAVNTISDEELERQSHA